MANYKIYCLKHPITNEIKYIGLTKNELCKRLSQHISDVYKKGGYLNYKKTWILSLKKENLKPKIELIEGGLTQQESVEKEKYYIKKFKNLGYKLTNGTDGGDIIIGGMTDEIKKKISIILKGRKNKNFIDLTGRVFGKLTVLEWDSTRRYNTFWKCTCECGKENLYISGKDLKKGKSASCGCKKVNNKRGMENHKSKCILQMNKETNQYINIYESILIASKKTNVKPSAIYDYIQGRYFGGGGYKWQHISKNEYNNFKTQKQK